MTTSPPRPARAGHAGRADPVEPRDEAGDRVARFDRVERVLHWVNAALFAVLIFTAAGLYLGSFGSVLGRREMLRTVHLYVGLAVPVVFLATALPRWGRALRADLRHINRWPRGERRWFVPAGLRNPRVPLRLGKFNPGQKLNAAFVLGSTTMLFASGLMLKWFGLFPDAWRTGATFVHDWFALFLGIAIVGHVLLGLRDQEALSGMVRGTVSAEWARDERPAWYDAVTAEARAETTPGTAEHLQ